MKIAVIVGAVLLSCSTGIGNARNGATAQFTIVSDRIVGGVRMGATLEKAMAVLGMPEVRRRLNDHECRAGWRTIGLTLLFLDLSNADPCGEGALIRATAASAKWQTGKGLRVGDPVARLHNLYRAATYHRLVYPGWWLITRRTCPTTGSQRYPGLLTRTVHHRIGALVVGIAACE